MYSGWVDSTRWLDDEEQQAWRSYLAATHLLAAQLDRELQRDARIPHTYYEILVRLSEARGRSLRMSDLADASESSRSRLSHAVARLESTGWVRRESCPTDRRGAFAVLTDTGFAALEAAAPGHVEGVRRHLFDRLTREQVGQLAAICDVVTEGLRQQPTLTPIAQPVDEACPEAS
jgi:DNA-binding MarR family transcriptional regulator